MNWNPLHRKIDNDKTKWYEIKNTQDNIEMQPIHCFICGKRIKGQPIPYGNFYVDEKCWKTNRYH